MKNAVGILIGNTLNLLIALDSESILTILILLNHQHERSFHLFVPKENADLHFVRID